MIGGWRCRNSHVRDLIRVMKRRVSLDIGCAMSESNQIDNMTAITPIPLFAFQ